MKFIDIDNTAPGLNTLYICTKEDGSYYINKGVSLSNSTIVKEILKDIDNIKWIIYHTRLASVGTVSNRNCHPFEHDNKILAMNGTERQYKIINGNLTDTENILLASENIRTDTRNYRSVFLGYENGKVFANKNCGSLKYIPCENGGKIFASNFPMEYYREDTVYEAPQIFVEGKKMKALELSAYYDEYYYMGLR